MRLERRLFPRVPVAECVALVETLDARGPWLAGPAEDLSPGGCQVMLEKPLRPGRTVRLSLHTGGQVIRAEGTVTHVRTRHGRGCQTGIAFTRVSPENLTTLRRAAGRTH